MKKTGWIVCTVALIITVMAGAALTSFAVDGGFELLESYPRDGQKNAAIENLGVKLTFSAPVNAEANQKANTACFSLTGPDGDLPIKVYYNPKIPEQVLVLHDNTERVVTVQGSQEFTVKISGNLVDNEGNTLGDSHTITFQTTNMRRNNLIYFVIMAVMMVGMVFFSSRQARAQAAADDSGEGQVEAFNPYKEAKRTGKPLSQVIAEHDKEVARQQAKEAKRIARAEAEDEYEEEVVESGNYKVKGPRPISAGGSSYITGRKAEAEAKAAEEERLAKRRAKNKKK